MTKFEFNRNDALVTIAAAIANVESVSFNGITRAAVYIWSADKIKTACNEMSVAFVNKGMTEGSAQNYVSKAKAVTGHLDALKLPPMPGEDFGTYADRIAPKVKAFWGSIRDIKSGGPGAAKKGERKKADDGAPSGTPPALLAESVSSDLNTFFATVGLFLSKATDGDLSKLQDMILKEQARREAPVAAAGLARRVFEGSGLDYGPPVTAEPAAIAA